MNTLANFLLLIESEACSGSWNMAVDEALLETARATGLPAVRFYRWNEPTLSLGYFQKHSLDHLPAELSKLPRVRRLSGGGAILHHHEWTYSCVLPATHPVAMEPLSLYEIVHQAIIDFLIEENIPARFRGDVDADGGDEPLLCFGRQDTRDIVLGPYKIVGSAQRRRKGAVLQHGSLLLRRSPFAADLPGLCDLMEREIPISEGIPSLAGRIAKDLGVRGQVGLIGEPPAPILELARSLEQEKYLPMI